ncbi:hypothetical protein LQK93_02209 [Terrabacter sp. BE26]
MADVKLERQQSLSQEEAAPSMSGVASTGR